MQIITFDSPKTRQMMVEGTIVTTTFNRLVQNSDIEWEMFWVVDNNGSEQATSNGTVNLTPEELNIIIQDGFLFQS